MYLELEGAERDTYSLQEELKVHNQCIAVVVDDDLLVLAVVLVLVEQQGAGLQDERVWSFLTGCACRSSSSSSIPQ